MRNINESASAAANAEIRNYDNCNELFENEFPTSQTILRRGRKMIENGETGVICKKTVMVYGDSMEIEISVACKEILYENGTGSCKRWYLVIRNTETGDSRENSWFFYDLRGKIWGNRDEMIISDLCLLHGKLVKYREKKSETEKTMKTIGLTDNAEFSIGQTFQSDCGDIYEFLGSMANGFAMFRDNGGGNAYAARKTDYGYAIDWANKTEKLIPTK